jgi:divalent metal cation (Fe/Co/Zn/Cd) transporter
MAFACVMAMLGLEIIVESIRKLVSKVRYVQDTLVVFSVFLLSFFWHNSSLQN